MNRNIDGKNIDDKNIPRTTDHRSCRLAQAIQHQQYSVVLGKINPLAQGVDGVVNVGIGFYG